MSKYGPLILKLVSRSRTPIIKYVASSFLEVRVQSTLAPASLHAMPELTELTTAVKPFHLMPAPPELPLLAHLPLMLKKESQEKIHLMFQKLRQEFGDIYRITVPGQGDMVILNNPKDIKTVYGNDGKIPIVPAFDIFTFLRVKVMKDRYVSPGLLVNHLDWQQVRSKVQQDMMRPGSALYYTGQIENIAIELIEKIGKQKNDDQVCDPYEALLEYSLETVGCVFMGIRLGTLKGEGDGKRLIDLNKQILPLLFNHMILPTWILPYLPSFNKLVSLYSESFDICKKHIDAAIDQVKEDDDSLIAKLVRKCGKDSGIPLAMAIDALQNGIDNVGSSAIFLLYQLASNPDQQEKLYREICLVLGPTGAVTGEALDKMKYMKACQTESQRLLPAIIGSSRRTTVDMVLSGYHVPAGTTVIKNGYGMSNDSKQFHHADCFMPERWLRACPQKSSAHPFANTPFGHGKRSCIAKRFAQLELYILMIKIVQKFKLEYDGPEIGMINKTFVNVPDNKVDIKFIERTS